MLVKEITYLILDEVKGISDDFTYTEEHVVFLLKKYRSLLLKKEQEKNKNNADISSDFENQQQICLDLEEVQPEDGFPCDARYYSRTVQEIPKITEGSTPRLYPLNFYQGINICFTTRDRMRYVGTNKYLQNIIYTSMGPDYHLYFTSDNPQFINLKKIRMSAVFDDFEDALELLCGDDGCSMYCDILDMEFPISGHLVPALIELVVKELTGAAYRPKDQANNANDDLANMAVKK